MSNKQDKTTDRNEVTSLLYTIANVAHSEYHLLESIVINHNNQDVSTESLSSLMESLDALRRMRSKLMKKLAEKKQAANGIWCTLKHLVLSEYHLWELYEKDHDKMYLDHALAVRVMLDLLLSNDDLGNLASCPRCQDDKQTQN